MLQDVVTASEGAAKLTRQTLAYAGKDQGRLRPLDIAAAAREVMPLLNASIPKMVRLSLELEDGIPGEGRSRAITTGDDEPGD